jgi:predicted ATPase/DNA-binding XRE family transcriptional regulator
MDGFAGTVRRLRVAAGLTQAELAEAAGISERTVSDLERGLRRTVYTDTARRLARAIGIEGAELSAFLTAAQGLPPASLSAAETGPLRTRLPARPTPLLGRDQEVARLLGLMRDPACRLCTIVGPGGVGKTRLAAEVAVAVGSDFPGGVFFIGLSEVDDPALLMPVVMAALGSLLDRRDTGEALLVLDTFEHLLLAAVAVSEIVANHPALTVLVTSRAALHVRGEQQVRLAPLPVGPASGGAALDLFLNRVRAVAPDANTDANVEVAAQVCERLDGLPLALELAAGRAAHMTLVELLRGLDHRLDPLTGGPRDLPARHRSMRAALDWSYALLDGTQLRLFRRLAVFRGGFTREALEAVMPADEESPGQLMASLSALVDSSLVSREAGSTGMTRYRLLDVVREYALERATAAGEQDRLRAAHAAHYLGLAEEAEPHLRSAGQREWFARLLDEEGNLRAALSHSAAAGDGETTLRLAASLWMFWRWAGMFREGRQWIETALRLGAESDSALRLRGLWGAGWLAFHQDDFRETERAGQAMLELLGDSGGVHRRNALTLCGNAALAEGRLQDAVAMLAAALAECAHGAPVWVLATSQLNLGTAQRMAGLHAEARKNLGLAQDGYGLIGDDHFQSRALLQLGFLEHLGGQEETAVELVREAMTLARPAGDAWSTAELLEATALLAADSDPPLAVALAHVAERLRDQISMRAHPADRPLVAAAVERARRSVDAEVDALESPLETAQAWLGAPSLRAEQPLTRN